MTMTLGVIAGPLAARSSTPHIVAGAIAVADTILVVGSVLAVGLSIAVA